MFGRKSAKEAEAAAAAAAAAEVAKPDGKGRPTPTRKEAEAARKANLKVPSDPKEARRAMRDRDRQQRAADRAAMAAGDESRLPARDGGPVRKLVRDAVDSRRSVGELFIPVAVLVLLTGFLKNDAIVQITYYVWLAMLVLVAADTLWVIYLIRRRAKAELPEAGVKWGDYLYGTMRSLTLRRLRMPPPRFRPGGKPVPPKGTKGS